MFHSSDNCFAYTFRVIPDDFYPKKPILDQQTTDNLQNEITNRALDIHSKGLRSKTLRPSCIILDNYEFKTTKEKPKVTEYIGTGKSPIDSIRGLVESIDTSTTLTTVNNTSRDKKVTNLSKHKSKAKANIVEIGSRFSTKTSARFIPTRRIKPKLTPEISNDSDGQSSIYASPRRRSEIKSFRRRRSSSILQRAMDRKLDNNSLNKRIVGYKVSPIARRPAGFSFLGSRSRVLKPPEENQLKSKSEVTKKIPTKKSPIKALTFESEPSDPLSKNTQSKTKVDRICQKIFAKKIGSEYFSEEGKENDSGIKQENIKRRKRESVSPSSVNESDEESEPPIKIFKPMKKIIEGVSLEKLAQNDASPNLEDALSKIRKKRKGRRRVTLTKRHTKNHLQEKSETNSQEKSSVDATSFLVQNIEQAIHIKTLKVPDKPNLRMKQIKQIKQKRVDPIILALKNIKKYDSYRRKKNLLNAAHLEKKKIMMRPRELRSGKKIEDYEKRPVKIVKNKLKRLNENADEVGFSRQNSVESNKDSEDNSENNEKKLSESDEEESELNKDAEDNSENDEKKLSEYDKEETELNKDAEDNSGNDEKKLNESDKEENKQSNGVQPNSENEFKAEIKENHSESTESNKENVVKIATLIKNESAEQRKQIDSDNKEEKCEGLSNEKYDIDKKENGTSQESSNITKRENTADEAVVTETDTPTELSERLLESKNLGEILTENADIKSESIDYAVNKTVEDTRDSNEKHQKDEDCTGKIVREELDQVSGKLSDESENMSNELKKDTVPPAPDAGNRERKCDEKSVDQTSAESSSDKKQTRKELQENDYTNKVEKSLPVVQRTVQTASKEIQVDFNDIEVIPCTGNIKRTSASIDTEKDNEINLESTETFNEKILDNPIIKPSIDSSSESLQPFSQSSSTSTPPTPSAPSDSPIRPRTSLFQTSIIRNQPTVSLINDNFNNKLIIPLPKRVNTKKMTVRKITLKSKGIGNKLSLPNTTKQDPPCRKVYSEHDYTFKKFEGKSTGFRTVSILGAKSSYMPTLNVNNADSEDDSKSGDMDLLCHEKSLSPEGQSSKASFNQLQRVKNRRKPTQVFKSLPNPAEIEAKKKQEERERQEKLELERKLQREIEIQKLKEREHERHKQKMLRLKEKEEREKEVRKRKQALIHKKIRQHNELKKLALDPKKIPFKNLRNATSPYVRLQSNLESSKGHNTRFKGTKSVVPALNLASSRTKKDPEQSGKSENSEKPVTDTKENKNSDKPVTDTKENKLNESNDKILTRRTRSLTISMQPLPKSLSKDVKEDEVSLPSTPVSLRSESSLSVESDSDDDEKSRTKKLDKDKKTCKPLVGKKKKNQRLYENIKLIKPLNRKNNELKTGDIIWGRCLGYGWWPGLILSFNSPTEVNLAWFSSTTKSTMSTEEVELFVPQFEKRFNTQKKGLYVKAVIEAQNACKTKYGTSSLVS